VEKWEPIKEKEQKMARIKVENTPSLEELIPLYGEQNTECNLLKKKVADLNSKIKAAIHATSKENSDIEVSGWKCSLIVSDASEFNEERLIEFCKAHDIKAVKKREYVDSEALEKLIYNGKISKELLVEMDKCKDVKTKETLRCVKIKEN
jgi:hypothetical protein